MDYRFLDGAGDIVASSAFGSHDEALAWAVDEDTEFEIYRVEFLGPEGDWRWAGALQG